MRISPLPLGVRGSSHGGATGYVTAAMRRTSEVFLRPLSGSRGNTLTGPSQGQERRGGSYEPPLPGSTHRVPIVVSGHSHALPDMRPLPGTA